MSWHVKRLRRDELEVERARKHLDRLLDRRADLSREIEQAKDRLRDAQLDLDLSQGIDDHEKGLTQ